MGRKFNGDANLREPAPKSAANGRDRRGRLRRSAAAVAAVAATATTVTLTIRERRARQRRETDVRERVTVKLRGSVIERARNAVFWTEGITLTSLIEESLMRAITRLERKNGKPFPERTDDLKVGRPSGR